MRYFSALLLPLFASTLQAAAPPGRLYFESDIRPVLQAHCTECHGEKTKVAGGLDLRLRRFALAGGDSGAVIVPGKPDSSALYERIRDHQMPPGKVKLSPAEIDLVRRWIASGALARRSEPAKLPPGPFISEEDRGFWSFRPIVRPSVPRVRQQDRLRSPIDAFVLAKLERHQLTFAPEADRYSLIRRLSFDLTGLPPTVEEVDGFVKDTSPEAYERLVDRLLSSPAYGERWGRHWLDVAGYADSHGYTGTDPVRPHAWKYRDWVIRSLNADMGYDQFLTLQLAGDQFVRPPYTNLSAINQERLIATGFLRTAPDGTASPGVERVTASDQLVADTIQIVSTAFLGLTMQCARCHNHRYDPISQQDYFRLRSVFEPGYDVSAWKVPNARLISLLSSEDRKRAAQIEQEAAKIDKERLAKQAEYIEATFKKQLAKVPEDIRATVEKAYRTPARKRNDAQQKLLQQHPSVNVSPGSLYLYDKKAADDLASLAARATKLRGTKPREDFIDALTETPGKAPLARLLERGDPTQPKQAIEPGAPSVLSGLGLPPISSKSSIPGTSGRRLALAQHLTDRRHPLTARVIVNRVWMHHFGKGIVNTPGDFGKLGELPSHPELLDWLADEFRRDWSLKRLHRLIVMSNVYRQSSRLSPSPPSPLSHQGERGRKLDPDNRLLWRAPVRRLEAESVRDAILAASGRLYQQMGGSPVPVMPDTNGRIVLGVDLRDGAGYLRGSPVLLGRDLYRRSVYVQVRRSMTLTVLESFDPPVLEPCSEKRASSTVAQQALMLMNSSFATGNAAEMAKRIRREAGSDVKEQVKRAWRLIYSRPPEADDLADATAFIEGQTALYQARKRAKGDTPEEQALAVFCQALLSSNGFLYVD